MQITRTQVEKVLEVLSHGVTEGQGVAVPGKMCVEAAVCYAFGEPHGDQPKCVNQAIIDFKIALNDRDGWGGNHARALGLRKLAIAQLGSKDTVNSQAFYHALYAAAVVVLTPYMRGQGSFGSAYRSYADLILLVVGKQSDAVGSYPVFSAVSNILSKESALDVNLLLAEIGLQALVAVNSPGVEYLYLVE